MKDVRLTFTTLSKPSLNDLLVHKKPSRSLLTKMETLMEEPDETDRQTVMGNRPKIDYSCFYFLYFIVSHFACVVLFVCLI